MIWKERKWFFDGICFRYDSPKSNLLSTEMAAKTQKSFIKKELNPSSNFLKFLRTIFLQNTSEQLLLDGFNTLVSISDSVSTTIVDFFHLYTLSVNINKLFLVSSESKTICLSMFHCSVSDFFKFTSIPFEVCYPVVL